MNGEATLDRLVARNAVAFGALASAIVATAAAWLYAPPADATTLRGFGAANVACLEWTDSCAVCRRDAAGGAAKCSLPGIACQPKPVACSKP
ncbi:MAG: hypothetical protein KGI57_12620 [Hyphomicrobiales bacterium]|nr:hypothetical protein [Hyphomicrobiales bacterium]